MFYVQTDLWELSRTSQPGPKKIGLDLDEMKIYMLGVMKKLECMLLLFFLFIEKIRVKKDIIFRQWKGGV